MKVKSKEYPFLGRQVEVPHQRRPDIKAIRDWLNHQPHLPTLNGISYLFLFHIIKKKKTTKEGITWGLTN
jgi:hypothetical protein